MSEGFDKKKEKRSALETIGTFTTPDQVGDLDFKKLLERPFFNGDFYLSALTRKGEFGKKVIDTSEPFSGIKGREYQESRVLRKEKDRVLMNELGVEPISLNEWRYLFSQMTAKQLAPDFNKMDRVENRFFVTFDDGEVKVLYVVFAYGEGPHGYYIDVENLDAEQYMIPDGSKVVSPKK
jgi:hypothetical protein